MEKGVFHTEISFLNLVEPNLDCSSTFRIDFAPNGIPFRAKSIRKCVGTIQIYFYSTRLRNDFARARFIGASNIYIYWRIEYMAESPGGLHRTFQYIIWKMGSQMTAVLV